MRQNAALSKVEEALSEAWGGDVRLSVQERFDEHPHVARLGVTQAPSTAPRTVILKRARTEGEDRFNRELSTDFLFNDWASLTFLSCLMGHPPLAPRVYAGNQEEGFIVIEDLANNCPLQETLWSSDSSDATQALIRYGELLGRLHGQSIGHLDLYAEILNELSMDYSLQPENYFDFFEDFVANLKRLDVTVPPLALEGIQEAAGLLSQPGSFTAFTHGDPVFGNIVEQHGQWRLIDFEAARFRHALMEGVYARMIFPTSGLRSVMRIPDHVWRQSESAYRGTLSEYVSEAKDVSYYGPATTAACAFWAFNICDGWLERAMADNLPQEMLSRIRQCVIARCEQFASTSHEFRCMSGLGEFFDELASQLRSRWPQEDCILPLYPAFH